MYTLRTIYPSRYINNTYIGNSYSFVDRFINYEEFKTYFKAIFDREHIADLDETSDDSTKNVIGFVICEEVIPIWKENDYYIMNDSGRTFERIHANRI